MEKWSIALRVKKYLEISQKENSNDNELKVEKIV